MPDTKLPDPVERARAWIDHYDNAEHPDYAELAGAAREILRLLVDDLEARVDALERETARLARRIEVDQ